MILILQRFKIFSGIDFLSGYIEPLRVHRRYTKHINKMKKYQLQLLVPAIAICLWSCGNNTQNDSKEVAQDANEKQFENTDKDTDLDFSVKAADGGLLEVKLGELAQANSSSAKVKEFGATMVADHTAANEELKLLAAKKSISLPTELGEKTGKDFNDLAEKKGAEFDKAYISYMIDDHKEDIDLFKGEADKGKDPEIKSFAANKIPKLEHHLMMAEVLKDELK